MENIQFERKTKKKKALKALVIIILMSVSFGAGLMVDSRTEAVKQASGQEKLGQLLGKYDSKGDPNANVNFKLFWDVWDLLKKDYVKSDKLNDKEMFYGAVKGMIASAGDPYTIFMDPKETKSFAQDLSGTFEGIGAEIGVKKDNLVVIAPLPESPAKKAGLRAGDQIVAINGESTLGLSIDQAVNKIRGPKDTEVKLVIHRPGEDKPQEVKITRGVIVVQSVKTEMRKDGIFIVTITNFNNDTEELFNKATGEILQKNPKGIILDLRNNPGGYLDTAVKVASKWVDKGVIVSEKSPDKKKDYLAEGFATLKNIPTVVLINQGSASASEIVAGALQDNGKATIIGKQSFGKGSVQIIEDLQDGSSLKVTVALWYTPKGNNINEKGITPDKVVDLTSKDYDNNKDPQLDAAVSALLNKK